MESSIQYAQLTSPNKASILWALARFETMARHGTMSPWQEQGGDGVHGFMKFYQLWNCFTGSGGRRLRSWPTSWGSCTSELGRESMACLGA